MDLLNNLPTKYEYSRKIQTSNYEQSVDNSKNNTPKQTSYTDIRHLFVDIFDPTCQIVESKDKPVYINQRLIELATEIDESTEKAYTRFNYSKLLKPSHIQQSLQLKNQLSSLLYLSDVYNVSSVVYIPRITKFIKTSQKTNRPTLTLVFDKGRFQEMKEEPTWSSYQEGSYEDLGECFELDCKSLDVYKPYLHAISKYKITELQTIAKEIQVSVDSLGKRKPKKQLYDDINTYYLNQSSV